MADDLEAFLRQAAQRRSQRQKTPQQRKSPPPKRTEPPRRPKPVTPPVAEDVPVAEQVYEAKVVAEQTPSRLGTRVSTSSFEERAGHLGEEVGLADEAMEAHLHEKFDHQLGRLQSGGRTPPPDSATGDAVSADTLALVEILQNPQSVRHAILLSEILARPEHRW